MDSLASACDGHGVRELDQSDFVDTGKLRRAMIYADIQQAVAT
jgi:hypothetical protein